MIVVRAIATILVALGAVLIAAALYANLVLSLPLSMSAGLILSTIDIGTLNLAQAIVQRYFSDMLWDYIADWLLLSGNIAFIACGFGLMAAGIGLFLAAPKKSKFTFTGGKFH